MSNMLPSQAALIPKPAHQSASLKKARASLALYPVKLKQLARWTLLIGDCPFLGSKGVHPDDEIVDALKDSFFVSWLRTMQPDFFQRYGAPIVACWESKDKGTEQAKCVTLYLCKAAHLGWIIPNQFGDARSKEMFFGWRGFRVVKQHSDAFKSGLTWLFSLMDGKQCEESTIQSFFIKANMKPAGTRWKQGFSGEVPFVYVPPATQAEGPASLGNIGFESPLHSTTYGDVGDGVGVGGTERSVEPDGGEASGVSVAAAGMQTVDGRVGGDAEPWDRGGRVVLRCAAAGHLQHLFFHGQPAHQVGDALVERQGHVLKREIAVAHTCGRN